MTISKKPNKAGTTHAAYSYLVLIKEKYELVKHVIQVIVSLETPIHFLRIVDGLVKRLGRKAAHANNVCTRLPIVIMDEYDILCFILYPASANKCR